MTAVTKTGFWSYKGDWRRDLPIWIILRLDKMGVPNWRADYLRAEYDHVSDCYWIFIGSYVAKIVKGVSK